MTKNTTPICQQSHKQEKAALKHKCLKDWRTGCYQFLYWAVSKHMRAKCPFNVAIMLFCIKPKKHLSEVRPFSFSTSGGTGSIFVAVPPVRPPLMPPGLNEAKYQVLCEWRRWWCRKRNAGIALHKKKKKDKTRSFRLDIPDEMFREGMRLLPQRMLLYKTEER